MPTGKYISNIMILWKGLKGWLADLKFSKKYSGFLIALFMTLALDSTMTFTMTAINVGWTAGFLESFVKGWLIGFVVALPTSLVVIPLAKRLTDKLVSE